MKAITIAQPFASLVGIGAKTIETREWSTDYRGPLAIHSGDVITGEIDAYLRSVLLSVGLDCRELPLGKIIAIARLTGCRKIVAPEIPCYPQLAFSSFVSGWYVLELSDIQPLENPVSVQGTCGLWDWEG